MHSNLRLIAAAIFVTAAAGCNNAADRDAGSELSDGGSASNNRAPTAAFTPSATTVTAGSALSFDGSGSTDPDGDALAFSWSFGDSTRGASAKLAHIFPSAGTFEVTLIIDDGRGGVSNSTKTITVTAGMVAATNLDATIRVFGPSRMPVSGASVKVFKGASATTNSVGVATVAAGKGVKQVVHVEAADFSRQIKVFTIDIGAADAVIEVELKPAPATLQLADAAMGGTLDGMLGAKVIIPAGGLRDAAGAAVTGAVDVQVTPVDVVSEPAAFPGAWSGLGETGSTGTLISFGAVDFTFFKNGEKLDLAAGKRATIELPVFAQRMPDGRAIAVGDILPVWSLDENSGIWVQEGTGVIVASASSPTGLAQRAGIGHFSWWNCDAFTDTHTLNVKCCIDADKDGTCEGAEVVCFVGAKTCNNDDCSDDSNPYPQYGATDSIPSSGKDLLMPNELVSRLTAYGPDGLTRGSFIAGKSAVNVSVSIALSPFVTSGDANVSLPFDTIASAEDATQVTEYRFAADAGQNIFVSAQRGLNSMLTARVRFKDPAGATLGDYPLTAAAASFVAPVTMSGRHVVEVQSTSAAPQGTYQLAIHVAGDALFVSSMSPAAGSQNNPVPATITVTLSRPIKATTINSTTFKVFGPSGEIARTSANGTVVNNETVTFTPKAPLGVGVHYRVQLTAGIQDVTSKPLVGLYNGTFGVADAIGIYTPVMATSQPHAAMSFDGSALMVGIVDKLMSYSRYTPDQGWSTPERLPAPVGPTFHTEPNVAMTTGGRAAILYTTAPGNGPPYSLYVVLYSPSTGFSSPMEVPLDATDRVGYQYSQIAIDSRGRVLVAWSGVTFNPTRGWFSWYVPGVGWSPAARVGEPSSYGDSRMAMNASGQAALGWRDTYDLMLTLFDPVTGSFSPVIDLGNNQAGNRTLAIDDNGNVLALRATGNLTSFLNWVLTDGGVQVRQVPGATNNVNCGPELSMSAAGAAMVASCRSGPTPFVDRWSGGDSLDAGWDDSYSLNPMSGVTALRIAASGEDFYTAFYIGNRVPTAVRRYSPVTGWDSTDVLTGLAVLGNNDMLISSPSRVIYVHQHGEVTRIK